MAVCINAFKGANNEALNGLNHCCFVPTCFVRNAQLSAGDHLRPLIEKLRVVARLLADDAFVESEFGETSGSIDFCTDTLIIFRLGRFLRAGEKSGRFAEGHDGLLVSPSVMLISSWRLRLSEIRAEIHWLVAPGV